VFAVFENQENWGRPKLLVFSSLLRAPEKKLFFFAPPGRGESVEITPNLLHMAKTKNRGADVRRIKIMSPSLPLAFLAKKLAGFLTKFRRQETPYILQYNWTPAGPSFGPKPCPEKY